MTPKIEKLTLLAKEVLRLLDEERLYPSNQSCFCPSLSEAELAALFEVERYRRLGHLMPHLLWREIEVDALGAFLTAYCVKYPTMNLHVAQDDFFDGQLPYRTVKELLSNAVGGDLVAWIEAQYEGDTSLSPEARIVRICNRILAASRTEQPA